MNYGDFIADVGALAMGSTTYGWIRAHEFADKDPSEWQSPYEIRCCVFTHREDEVIVSIAPVTLGAGAPLLPRRLELRLDDVARNGDFVAGKFSVVRPPG